MHFSTRLFVFTTALATGLTVFNIGGWTHTISILTKRLRDLKKLLGDYHLAGKLSSANKKILKLR